MKQTSKGKGFGTESKTIVNAFNIHYGTLDTRKCKGIYINYVTYVVPDTDYRKDISVFKTQFERHVASCTKNMFQSNIKHIICTIDDRDSNLNNRLNTTQTLLGIEVTILFDEIINYKESLDAIHNLIKLFIIFFESYKGLSIEAQRHKQIK